MARDKVVKAGDPRRALIKAIAMDIGKEMVAYLEVQYNDVFEKMNSGCRLSIRNHIHNDIAALMDTDLSDEKKIIAWIKRRVVFRRQWLAAWRGIRKPAKARKLPPP